MADDLLDKGAIVQRDKETYAIAPHIPGGIITDFNLLRRLADVAEKFGVKAVKLTSAERFALVGLKPGDLDQAWQELGLIPGAAIGLCVRSIKICPGTTFCRLGLQDAVGVGLKLDEKYHGMPLPYKFKIGVSGCANNCSETSIKDLGLMGMNKGLRVLAGGYASGLHPRLADVIATGLSDAEALDHRPYPGLVQTDRKKEAPGQNHRRNRPGPIPDGTGPACGVSERSAVSSEQ